MSLLLYATINNTVDSNLPALVKPSSSISGSRPRARTNDRDALVRVLDESRFHLHVDCDRASPWLLARLLQLNLDFRKDQIF
jgi:hypothetical protein